MAIPAHTASVLFDTDNTLWVGVPDGEVKTLGPIGGGEGQLSVLKTFPARSGARSTGCASAPTTVVGT